MPFNLGPAELIIILAISLIVFGPKKLPEIGRGIGQAMREFNKARNDFMDSLNHDVERDPGVSSASSASSYATDSSDSPAMKSLEYPAALSAEHADALPFGGEFHAEDGDSQPAMRGARTADVVTASLPVSRTTPAGAVAASQSDAA